MTGLNDASVWWNDMAKRIMEESARANAAEKEVIRLQALVIELQTIIININAGRPELDQMMRQEE